jgi:hypothetical protein
VCWSKILPAQGSSTRPQSISGYASRGAHKKEAGCKEDSVRLASHEPRLLVLSVGILLLSCLDAFLTLILLQVGGVELNPFMDFLIHRDIRLFVNVKILITAVSIVVLAAFNNLCLFWQVTVHHFLYGLFFLYATLAIYELNLLGSYSF